MKQYVYNIAKNKQTKKQKGIYKIKYIINCHYLVRVHYGIVIKIKLRLPGLFCITKKGMNK